MTFIYIIVWLWLLLSFIWIVSAILYFSFGIEKPMDMLLYVVDKTERENQKSDKKLEKLNVERERVEKYGTPEEKVQFMNKLNPDYQMMTDDEVKEKYKGLDFSKVIILDLPNNIWNIDEQKFVNGMEESHEVVPDTDDNMRLQIKPGNRNVSVDSYSLIQINALNKCNKIAIYRHKSDEFRYKVLDNIK